MRPCQHCNAPLENQQRTCPTCGAEQVATVGLSAPSQNSATIDQDLESCKKASKVNLMRRASADDAGDERIVELIKLAMIVIVFVGLPALGAIAGSGVGMMIGFFAAIALLVAFSAIAGGAF